MCLLEVTSFLGEGVHSIRGKPRTLDNICSSVFVNMQVSAKFGLIKQASEDHARLPCLLLFAQDLFLACCLSLSVLELWIAECVGVNVCGMYHTLQYLIACVCCLRLLRVSTFAANE